MPLIKAYSDPLFTWISSYARKTEKKQNFFFEKYIQHSSWGKIPCHGRDLWCDFVIMAGFSGHDSVESEILTVGDVINVVENVWSVGETVVKRGNWRGQWRSWEMLSTLTSVISGRTKICDIDMLLIVGTSSLFSNVMQTVHELMTLLPLHWYSY